MAKMTVTVDNDLDNVKLESTDKLESKKQKKAEKKVKKQKKVKDPNKESYFAKVRKEMKLVTWPTRKNVIKYSLATILMIIFLAAFFIGVSALFDILYRLAQGWIG